MKLHVIFGLRSPDCVEALDVIDEYGDQENPAWLNERMLVHKANTDLLDVQIIDVEVDYKKILEIFDRQVIPGTVKEHPHD
jgi:hypothetical protein